MSSFYRGRDGISDPVEFPAWITEADRALLFRLAVLSKSVVLVGVVAAWAWSKWLS